ncbi:substrate-binding domain-containing protein [Petroclostridium sp. X23]|uniref:sugar ABC transporter substrate-binding protein n=1 Tax=Petroclostridium sp. X23 TaxID=3045146 RepID=UPI0024ADD7B5|nr:substrate-binding domain-containing protein [Petroclostridium sp. X23]WHH56824.1 substrate-binding domain-containing protein [Petroclostridium sp. X23]
MKKFIAVVLSTFVVMSVFFVGCNSTTTQNESAKSQTPNTDSQSSTDTSDAAQEENTPKEYKIGYTCPTLNNPFFVGMKEGAELAASERGLTLTMLGGDNNVAKQVQQIEDFIAQGVDAIIVQAVDTTGIVTGIEAANEANIPVFTTAESPTGGRIECAIVFDSYESGFNGGTYIGKVLEGKGNVVELQGILGQETSREKSRGFVEALKQYPDIKLLASQPANYDRATAMSVTENMLQTYDEINAVYAANDEMALGAMQAIEAAGKLGDIFIMGNDGTEEALKAIADSKLGATNGTPGYIQGYIAIDIASRYLNGEKVPEIIKERNTIIDKSNLSQTDKILKGVSKDDWYWLEQLEN